MEYLIITLLPILSERIVIIGQYLSKLWQKVCLLFFICSPHCMSLMQIGVHTQSTRTYTCLVFVNWPIFWIYSRLLPSHLSLTRKKLYIQKHHFDVKFATIVLTVFMWHQKAHLAFRLCLERCTCRCKWIVCCAQTRGGETKDEGWSKACKAAEWLPATNHSWFIILLLLISASSMLQFC